MESYYEEHKEDILEQKRYYYQLNRDWLLQKAAKKRREKGIKPRTKLTPDERKQRRNEVSRKCRTKRVETNGVDNEREKERRYANKYYHDNIEKRRAYNRKKAKEYRERNPEAYKKYQREYKQRMENKKK